MPVQVEGQQGITPEQFASIYGFQPNVPQDAFITKIDRTPISQKETKRELRHTLTSYEPFLVTQRTEGFEYNLGYMIPGKIVPAFSSREERGMQRETAREEKLQQQFTGLSKYREAPLSIEEQGAYLFWKASVNYELALRKQGIEPVFVAAPDFIELQGLELERKAKHNLLLAERMTEQRKMPFVRLGGAITTTLSATVFNPKWWRTDPTTGIDVTELGKDTTSGRTIPLTAWDIYNVATVGLMGYAAVKAVVTSPFVMEHLPGAIQRAYYGSYEYGVRQIQKQLPEAMLPFESSKEYAEFWLQTQQPLEVKLTPEKWFLQLKGEPTTPMDVTLGKVVKEPIFRGGVPGQTVTPMFGESVWKMPPALREIAMLPKTFETTRSFFNLATFSGMVNLVSRPFLSSTLQRPRIETNLSLKPLSRTIPKISTSTIQQSGIKQVQEQMTTQTQKQIQTQIQKQLQAQRQVTVPKLRTTSIFEEPWAPKRRRKRATSIGSFGRYKRFYPVMTAKELMKLPKVKI